MKSYFTNDTTIIEQLEKKNTPKKVAEKIHEICYVSKRLTNLNYEMLYGDVTPLERSGIARDIEESEKDWDRLHKELEELTDEK